MTISSEVSAFVASQNTNRGTNGLNLDFNALTGAVPAGDNAVTGISGIAASAAPIALTTGTATDPAYGAVIFDGVHSTTAAAAGSPDSYSFSVDANGLVTVLDNNTGQTETITGANYLVFNGAATATTGAFQSIYFIEGSTNAQIAALYNAALGRQPDLAGLEFYATPIAQGTLSLHQAAVYFLASPEFQHDFAAAALPADDGGPNDQAFIQALYANVLHRTASAKEVAYYVSDLQGTLPGVAQQDRAQLLINFSLSPENQKDISGWLINTTTGGYADSTVPLAPQTVISQGVGDGTVNLGLVGSVTSSTDVTVTTSAGTTTLIGAGNTGSIGLPASWNELTSTVSGLIVDLSSSVETVLMAGANQTVYGTSAGGANVLLASTLPVASSENFGGTVFLYGTGNTIRAGSAIAVNASVTTPTTIYGFGDGDVITRTSGQQGLTTSLLTGSTSAPIQTSGLDFAHNLYAVNLGSVGNGTAAEMASAANAMVHFDGKSGEEFVFYGQTTAGNTAVYLWEPSTSASSATSLTANSFRAGEMLIGVTTSEVHASWFQ